MLGAEYDVVGMIDSSSLFYPSMLLILEKETKHI